jgi:hypothetical protein
MVEQRAVLCTAARLGRGRVGATIETMPGLDRHGTEPGPKQSAL